MKIQDKILLKLSKGDDLRFKDILLKEIDSNLFTYHLKKLRAQNLVSKNGLRYNLTDFGKVYVDSLSGKTNTVRPQPKVANLIICENSKKQFLMFKRSKHPFLNKIGFVYGKQHVGEKIYDSAKRELLEKTGLSGELKNIGNCFVIVKQGKNIVNHTFFNIFYCSEFDGELIAENNYGNFSWQDFELIKKDQLVPGTAEIFDLLGSKKFVFSEFEVNL